MAYTKQTWVDGTSVADAEKLNHIEDGIFDANKMTELNCTILNHSHGASELSVQNSSYERLTSDSIDFEVKNGSAVLIYFKIGGLWNTDTGYGIRIKTVMDDTIDCENYMAISPAVWAGNWSTDGARRIEASHIFVFKNVTPGTHNFKFYWASNNNNVTAYFGAYAIMTAVTFEI